MKHLFTLSAPTLAVLAAGLATHSANAQWIVSDPGNLAQAIVQVQKLVEQVNLINEQIDLQKTIRDAADNHLYDFRRSLESRLSFDVEGYLDRHLDDILQYENSSHVNPRVISSKTRSEADIIEYFDYRDPSRLESFDGEEHEFMLFSSINESMNEIRDARARLTTTAGEITNLARKARNASTPEERRQLQIEVAVLQAKQENEAQMLEIARADINHLLDMNTHAEVVRQQTEASSMNQNLLKTGDMSRAEADRRIKAVERTLQTKGKNPKRIRLRPTTKKEQ